MIEQLDATEIRIATETALNSGTGTGDWWAPPFREALGSPVSSLLNRRETRVFSLLRGDPIGTFSPDA